MDGRVVVFPSTSPNELRVTLYDPLRGVPVAELEVIKSKEKLRHGLTRVSPTWRKPHADPSDVSKDVRLVQSEWRTMFNAFRWSQLLDGGSGGA